MPTSTIKFLNTTTGLCHATAQNWANPDKCLLEDGVGATCTVASGASTTLVAYGPDADEIPADAVIDSITLVITARQTLGVAVDVSAYIAKDATDCGEWVSLSAATPFWSGSFATKEFDVDPTGWTGADFASTTNLGAAYHFAKDGTDATLELDEFRLDVVWHVCRVSRVPQPGCCDCNTCPPQQCTIFARTFNRSDTTDITSKLEEVSGDSAIVDNSLVIPASGEVQCTVENPNGDSISTSGGRIKNLKDGASASVFVADGDVEARVTRADLTYTVELLISGVVQASDLGALVPNYVTIDEPATTIDLQVCNEGAAAAAAMLIGVTNVASTDNDANIATGTKAGMKAAGSPVEFKSFSYSILGGNCRGCVIPAGGCNACTDGKASSIFQAEVAGITNSNCSTCDDLNGTFHLYFDGTSGDFNEFCGWSSPPITITGCGETGDKDFAYTLLIFKPTTTSVRLILRLIDEDGIVAEWVKTIEGDEGLQIDCFFGDTELPDFTSGGGFNITWCRGDITPATASVRAA